jgi:hypothetical protein
MSINKNQNNKQLMEVVTIQIREIHEMLGKHITESDEFRRIVAQHSTDISWIKNVGAWVLGSGGLVGIVYGIITLIIK